MPMNDGIQIAHAQLGRMRAMTGMYHRRFFFDVNFTTVAVVTLFIVAWAGVDEAFLLIPVAALMGAVATAFDASYLMFARWYAKHLEDYLNEHTGSQVLVAAKLEDVYLFPLGAKKIVTIPLEGHFSWFSFVTVLYTTIGALAYAFGLALGWDTLVAAPTAAGLVYLGSLFALTSGALIAGVWWFVLGAGERRLQTVLDDEFGEPLNPMDDSPGMGFGTG